MTVTLTARPRAWHAAVLALVTVLTLLVSPGGAFADPNEDGDSKTQTLVKNLEAAAHGYVEATSALEESKAKQADLKRELTAVEKDLAPLRKQVGVIAATAYTNGRLSTLGAMLAATSSDDFLSRATMLEEMTLRDDEALHRLVILETRAKDDKQAIDAEASIQATMTTELSKRLKTLELTLSQSGGGKATLNWPLSLSPTASPAPHTSSGGLPADPQNIKDPTGTGGRITSRLLHAYNEARRFGFTRFTKCWRTQSWGEHPKGRACDFSVTVGGFSGRAAGTDRVYGDKLAAFFVKNAKALGVYYVIWFRMIWLPGVGWHNYSGCCDPSAEHLNHVHLSML
jgi:peptidoglycan DL-endopeptidase CwlO